jgi:diguanylate cyclase (GGDEF)-like protein
MHSHRHSLKLEERSLSQPQDLRSPCQVVLVDDDELIRSRLTLLLREAGYQVLAAASAEEAMPMLDTMECRVVIADWQMPGMDGLALCRHVRCTHNDGYTYFMMLSVRGARRDVLRGLAAGVDDYLVKGACNEEILARVEVGRRLTQLERSRQTSNREHRRLAMTDPLTGARNHRYLMHYLARELERSRRYVHPLAILSCDIDGLKEVNDRLGHGAGDEVLRRLAGCAVECIRRSSDWVARVGGDEFVVVLPESNLIAANTVAGNLRQRFTSRPVAAYAGLNLTVSIGATALESAQELASHSVSDLLRAADQCLRASKRNGRDEITAESVARASLQQSS